MPDGEQGLQGHSKETLFECYLKPRRANDTNLGDWTQCRTITQVIGDELMWSEVVRQDAGGGWGSGLVWCTFWNIFFMERHLNVLYRNGVTCPVFIGILYVLCDTLHSKNDDHYDSEHS